MGRTFGIRESRPTKVRFNESHEPAHRFARRTRRLHPRPRKLTVEQSEGAGTSDQPSIETTGEVESTETDANDSLSRRHYVFGLRGELPLPESGWTVVVHPAACDESGVECPGTPQCSRVRMAFLKAARVNSAALTRGLSAMSGLLNRLLDKRSDQQIDPPLHLEQRLQVAVSVSAPIGADAETTLENHFDTCLKLLRDSARAMQMVTSDLSSPVTRQQLLPLYFIVDEDRAGNRTAPKLVLMDDAYLGSPFAEPGLDHQATRFLAATWSQNPVENYHDLKLGAQRAQYAEGNYVDAVLRAAAACEVLVKHVAWMTTWEAREVVGNDPLADALATSTILTAKPADLIGKVLTARLNGNWSSRLATAPVGAWRYDVAKLRNRVIHRGYRPSEAESAAAIAAVQVLETHVMDRLAVKVATFPRSALLLVGHEGLQRRDQFGPARATWKNEDLFALLRAYNAWLEHHQVDDLDN